jgi:uracil phosphoribosyltransferase
VQTPLAPAPGYRLAVQPVFVPILRAALGMVEAALQWVPDADVSYVGLARNEHTFQPDSYLDKLPPSLANRPTFVLDPMLATGGSLAYCCQLVADRGAPTPITVVCVLAAPEGITRLTDWSNAAGIDVNIYTAAVDERLNDTAYILPGLGDAGDRQFG